MNVSEFVSWNSYYNRKSVKIHFCNLKVLGSSHVWFEQRLLPALDSWTMPGALRVKLALKGCRGNEICRFFK